jgi:hypothetical protein
MTLDGLSVRDRECYKFAMITCIQQLMDRVVILRRRSICCKAYARSWIRREGFQGLYMEIEQLEDIGKDTKKSRV